MGERAGRHELQLAKRDQYLSERKTISRDLAIVHEVKEVLKKIYFLIRSKNVQIGKNSIVSFHNNFKSS